MELRAFVTIYFKAIFSTYLSPRLFRSSLPWKSSSLPWQLSAKGSIVLEC